LQEPSVSLPGGLELVLATLSEALDWGHATELWQVPDRGLAGAAVECGRLTSRMQALLVRLLGEVHARDLALRSGACSTTAWTRHALNQTPREARTLVGVATALRIGMATTGAAFAAGELSLAQAAAITTTVGELPDDVPAEALERQEQQARRRRELFFTPDGHGTVFVRGRLTDEAAAIVRAALDPLARPLPRTADGPDPRTAGERRADALEELARRALAGHTLRGSGQADRSESRAVYPSPDPTGDLVEPTHETGDRHRPRFCVEPLDGVELLDATLDQHGHPLGQARLVEVMGHHHDRGVEGGAYLAQEVVHGRTQARVKRTERLIEQHHSAARGKRTGEGDPLLLAAGELSRPPARHVSEVHQVQVALGRGAALSAAQAAQPISEGHVVEHTQVREEMWLLEHHREVSSLRGYVQHAGPVD